MADGDELKVLMSSGRVFRYAVSEEDAECQQCGEAIHWVTTHNERQMPVDVPELGEMTTTCHFETCAARLRRSSDALFERRS